MLDMVMTVELIVVQVEPPQLCAVTKQLGGKVGELVVFQAEALQLWAVTKQIGGKGSELVVV